MTNSASDHVPARFACDLEVTPLAWGMIAVSLLCGMALPFLPDDVPALVSIVTKGLAVGLLAVAAMLLPVSQRGWLAAIMAFGSLGDVLLELPGLFFAGAGAFAIGHCIGIGFYGRAMRPDARWHERVAGLALIGWGLAMPGLVSAPGTPVGALMLYSVLLCGMAAALLLSRLSRIAVVGALLFIISDTLLIMRLGGRVVGGAFVHGLLVWWSYYLGQLLIFAGVAMRLSPRAAR